MSPGPMIGQGFAPPGFGNIGMGIGAYGYGMNGMGAVGQMQGMGVGGGYMQQEQQVNGRRGRVCFPSPHIFFPISN